MPSLATATDLATYLRQDVDTAAADDAIAYASDAVLAYLGQQIAYTADDVVILDMLPGSSTVILPELPVVDVTVVEVLSDPVTWVVQEAAVTWSWSAAGLVYVRAYPPYWGWAPSRSVRVTYSHGYPTIPPALVGVVLDRAAQIYKNPASVGGILTLESESIDDYSREVRYAQTSTAGGFTPLELAVLNSFRGAAVA